jgi:hypothetical protein
MEGQASARVTKIFKHKNQFLVSTTSKYCENLAREHGSNHVWFYVSGDLITQKCFCRCETLEGRADGFCKDFTGKRYALTGEIKRMLYPEPTKCPPIVKKIKKKERRPTAVDEARVELQAFIQNLRRRVRERTGHRIEKSARRVRGDDERRRVGRAGARARST